MRAELKGLDTADAEGGELVAFCPDDAAHFALGVTASIGPAGEDGAELFQFEVCSPSWLAKQSLPKGFAFQRHKLLLERWDPELVERAIRDLCLRTAMKGGLLGGTLSVSSKSVQEEAQPHVARWIGSESTAIGRLPA